MKAVRIHSYGGSDQIRVEDIPTPTPNDNQILVKVRAVGVNPFDWKVREGYMKEVMPAQFPLTLGHDFAGEVLQVGKGVHDYKPGDRVYGVGSGAYAEQVIVSEDKIAKIPPLVDFITAATIPTAGITAYQLVMNATQLREGQTVLIHGAAGGVGSFAVQLAFWKKAQIFATADQSDFDYLKELGVRELIDFKKERFEDRVKSVDVVIDLVGGEILKRSLAVVKPGGILATTVGPLDEKQAAEKNVKGIQFYAKQNSEDLSEMAKLVADGVLKPRIYEILPLEEAKLAQDRLQKGQSHGKIILQVGSQPQ
ncbi:MAG: NADP-dependent oxidoreductase [Pseudobdellovibrionaceae bacterium]